MNSMNDQDEKNNIEKLIQIHSKIQDQYYNKKEQLEKLKMEISEMSEIINVLNSMISNKSFQTADKIYSQNQDEVTVKGLEEKFFKEGISTEQIKDAEIKRKIFSKDNQEKTLICVLNFTDFNYVDIKFIKPNISEIKESSENFVNIFLRGALIPIKERNSNLDVKYNYYKNTDIIESISITDLKSIEDYDLITNKIQELLTLKSP